MFRRNFLVGREEALLTEIERLRKKIDMLTEENHRLFERVKELLRGKGQQDEHDAST
jgi:cell division protein FtsB